MTGSTNDNFASLHSYEEKLRDQSLAGIQARDDLRDHWEVIREAMSVIHTFVREHPHQSDDELTLQLLGLRLFNAAGVSVKLALSGYYQKAFDQVRDVIETYFLIDYLRTYPDKIAVWKAADKKTRIAKFGPGAVRNALDARDGYKSGNRKRIYDLISELASHASYAGFSMVMNDKNLGEIGPFFSEKFLATWLQEMAMRLSHGAVVLASNAEGQDLKLLRVRAKYLDVVNRWTAKYFQSPRS